MWSFIYVPPLTDATHRLSLAFGHTKVKNQSIGYYGKSPRSYLIFSLMADMAGLEISEILCEAKMKSYLSEIKLRYSATKNSNNFFLLWGPRAPLHQKSPNIRCLWKLKLEMVNKKKNTAREFRNNCRERKTKIRGTLSQGLQAKNLVEDV